jgi:formylglycine-generating enzyme required for sulfatase activity
VRDSIAHAMLGHYVKAGDKQYIDWSKKLDWQKDKKLAELYFKGDDQYHRKTALDNSKLIYSSGKYSNKPLNIYPDTICWVRDFSYAYNEALSANYFSHSAYTDFPVVGVSWEQALAYCDWKSNQINVLLRKMGQTEIDIRLPNEMEWEFAARSEASEINEKSHFAWSQSDSKILDKDGNYLANFGPIKDENGILIKDYMETGQNDNFGALYCSKVGTFAPYNGMYDLAGNVDEWVLDRAIPSDLNYCFDEFEGNDNLDKLRRADLNFESFCSNYFDSIFAKKDEAAYRKKMQIVLEEILAGTNIKPYLKKYTLNQILDELTKEFRMLCADDKRLAKGGSWNSDLANVATGSRRAYNQNRGYSFVGFRIACSSVQKIK